jgi:endoglucanase
MGPRCRFVTFLFIAAQLAVAAGAVAQPAARLESATTASTSTDVKVDQVGYLPASPKLAMIVSTSASGPFVVRREPGGAVMFRGTLSAPVFDVNSGDRIRTADFSSLSAAGTYVLEVAGVGRSVPFTIRADVFARAYYLALRSFYGQRCGTAVDLGPQFPGYAHAACHTANGYHPSSGRAGNKSAGNKGWHDAGDYGRYVVNSGLTTGTLLWAYELFGSRVAAIRLDIPESSNAVPDILDEIRWNLEWMLSMQDTDGGVFHKQTSEQFSGFVMPDQDTLTSYVIGTGSAPFKSTCATADFAAVTAIAARTFGPHDAAFAATALDASRRAFTWATRNPDVRFMNPKGVATGGYGDRSCADELLWASAELWRTTKDVSYQDYFRAHVGPFLPSLNAVTPPSWANVAPMALWAYALGGANDNEAATIKAAVLASADGTVRRAAADGYRTSLANQDYIWGSNAVAANYGMQLLVANRIAPAAAYRDAAADNLHYLLGRNTFALSWVTQVGTTSFAHPHHRPSGADTNVAPWPGLLAGGPNARKQDPAMQKLADLPPAKMYLDDQESYATNEVAINWNAPLVFLLAGQLPVPARR